MATNRNRRTRTAPPKARDEYSLLEQAAIGARQAKDKLDELQAEAHEADARFHYAEAAYLAAQRERNVAHAHVRAQKSVYESHLCEAQQIGQKAVNELYQNDKVSCVGLVNTCVPEGAAGRPY